MAPLSRVQIFLHNVTQSLPIRKMLRNMEAESKQGCGLAYRYTTGITIVLPFFRSLYLAVLHFWVFLYRFFFTAPADHRAGTRGHTFRRDGCRCIRRFPSIKNNFFLQNSRINDNFLLLPAIRQSSFHLFRSHTFSCFSYLTHHASEKRSGGLLQFCNTNA